MALTTQMQDMLNKSLEASNANTEFQQKMAENSAESERALTAINVARTYESGRNASMSKNAETNAKIGKMGADASNKLWG